MGNINGRFADQDHLVVTSQVLTSDNNQTTLTASILEANHLRASTAALQPDALTMNLTTNVPNVLGAAQSDIGAALAGIGQQGTPSEGGGGDGEPTCPEIHEFVYVRSDINTPIPLQARYVEVGMHLWNPIQGTFEKVVLAETKENQPLWDVGGWAVGSFADPIIQRLDDTKGLALSKCGSDTGAVRVMNGLVKEERLSVTDLKRRGTVRHLETAGPTHIYAHGTMMETALTWHNLKPIP